VHRSTTLRLRCSARRSSSSGSVSATRTSTWSAMTRGSRWTTTCRAAT